MSEKKVSKSVAVALGIVSVVLGASLVGVFAYYVPMMNDKNNTIVEKDLIINEKNNIIDELNDQISQLTINATTLQNQVNNLTDALNLHKFTVWYNGTMLLVPLLEVTMLEEHAPCAGYVSVHASSPQGNETFVTLVYYSEALDYRHEDSVNLGSNGTAIFPVLPSDMAIYFADPHLIDQSRTATVTVIYYY